MNPLTFTSNNEETSSSENSSNKNETTNAATRGNDDDKKKQSGGLMRCQTTDLSDSDDGSEDSVTPRDCEQDNAAGGVQKMSNEPRTPSLPNRDVVWSQWTQWTEKLHNAVNQFVVALSMCAARNPKRCIVSVIVLSFALLSIGFFTNFHVNVEETEIYAPFDSIPQRHFQWRNEESGFSQTTRVTVLVLHNHGENVMHKAAMRRVFEALETVRNTTGYDEVCQDGAYWDSETQEYTCRVVSATRAWYHDVALFDDQVSSDQDLANVLSLPEYPGGAPFDHEYVMGNLVREDTLLEDGTNVNNGTITHVPAFLVYILVSDKGEQTKELEASILQNLFDLKTEWKEEAGDEDFLELDFFCERSLSDEFKRAIEEDMYLVPVIFFMMSFFTCLVFFKSDRVQSRCLVGVGSVTTIGMSLFSGFGIMFIFGVPFTSMTQLLPFLVFGVGLDDTFIITGEYLRTDPSLAPEERIRLTMQEVGSCITVTTITTASAFLLGLMSSVPAIHWLCLYAFPTIIIDYLYQITFFVAILVLDERRIQAQRTDCCLCLTRSATEDEEEQGETGAGEIGEPSKHIADRIMAWYAVQLMRPVVKAVVAVVFAAVFGFCAYRTSLLTQEFEVTELFPEGSYVTNALENLYANQERTIAAEITFRHVNQSDPIIQQQMMDFIEDITELPPFGVPPPICWVRDFQAMRETAFFDTIADLPFGEQVQYALTIPAIKEAYGDDIVVDEDGNILASRCRILAQNSHLEEVQDKISLLGGQRAVTNAQPINQGRKDDAFFTFVNLYLIWEFYSIAVDELIFTTVSSVVAVSVVALIFIPHWSAVFFMIPMISIVYIDLLGVMQLVGLHINAVTYVCLVISVGLIVDFLLHIMLRYTESTHKAREAKVIDTLETMGASILLGGLSTFLGVLPLALSTSTIMRTVFTALCSMVILAITHGLILLPVILSVVGPVPKGEATPGKLEEEEDPTPFASDSSWGSPKSLSPSTSWVSLFSPPGKSEGNSDETVEEFLANCADEMANDAFSNDPVAARKEKADLLKTYTGIFQSTLDPSAFLAQLGDQVAAKRNTKTVEYSC